MARSGLGGVASCTFFLPVSLKRFAALRFVFTFGMLLWSDRHVPLWIVAIPAAWAVIGTSAAMQLSITEDYGLLVSAALSTAYWRCVSPVRPTVSM